MAEVLDSLANAVVECDDEDADTIELVKEAHHHALTNLCGLLRHCPADPGWDLLLYRLITKILAARDNKRERHVIIADMALNLRNLLKAVQSEGGNHPPWEQPKRIVKISYSAAPGSVNPGAASPLPDTLAVRIRRHERQLSEHRSSTFEPMNDVIETATFFGFPFNFDDHVDHIDNGILLRAEAHHSFGALVWAGDVDSEP
ncbi:hypothetical protein HK101_006957, partial [Irineochytrium annulatum]